MIINIGLSEVETSSETGTLQEHKVFKPFYFKKWICMFCLGNRPIEKRERVKENSKFI